MGFKRVTHLKPKQLVGSNGQLFFFQNPFRHVGFKPFLTSLPDILTLDIWIRIAILRIRRIRIRIRVSQNIPDIRSVPVLVLRTNVLVFFTFWVNKIRSAIIFSELGIYFLYLWTYCFFRPIEHDCLGVGARSVFSFLRIFDIWLALNE